jgi:catechol 2,3-dioxygenase-like lactoylglutathione lyase family enzyme
MTVASPTITGLAHVTVNTADLATTIAFYEQVIGLQQVARPPFSFPGAWLGFGTDALVHLVGGDQARAADGRVALGTGAIDHVSFWARGYQAQRARLEAFGLPFRESCPPQTTLAQIFVFDPNGVLVELTYDLRNEPGAVPGNRSDRMQWNAALYRQFAQERGR